MTTPEQRKPFIAGNWKMNKTVAESLATVRELSNLVAQLRDRVDIAVAPPFTALYPVAKQLEGTNVLVAGQDLYWEPSGAFTGEVSGAMLKEAGCTCVIIAHSERRQFFGETDQTANKKLAAALKAGLVPIFCVGETLQEREAGRTLEVVGRHVRQGLAGYSATDLARLVIAYEPVWAIGTGKVATSAQAQEVHGSIRAILTETIGAETAKHIRIQYGGSVKPENIADLMSKPDVDGALVGGASLKADEFARIVKYQQGT
jgi:triosephosphate isomerase